MIDWRPMTEWPPKKRHHSDEFLFWQPATANGRTVLSARAVVERFPPGPRQTTRWARIEPPKSDVEENHGRVVAAVRLLRGRYYLGNFFFGPAYEGSRCEVLSALTGSKVGDITFAVPNTSRWGYR